MLSIATIPLIMYIYVAMEHPFKVCDKMRNKKYHTVETVLKYHTVETVLKSNRIIAETETKSIPLMHTCNL